MPVRMMAIRSWSVWWCPIGFQALLCSGDFGQFGELV
jgi:hypothetical protein